AVAPPFSGRPSTRSASSLARLCPICSSSRSAALSSSSIFTRTCSSAARASAFAASIICAASASALRRSLSRRANAPFLSSAIRSSRSASASRACLISSSVRSFKSLNRRSRSDSRFRNGRKNNRLNINQKTRNETISAKNVPQFGGICILRRLPRGDFRSSLHHRKTGTRTIQAELNGRQSGLLLPSGGDDLRHALGLCRTLLLGEYGNFAVFAYALGLHRTMSLEQRAFLHRQNRRRDISADLGRRTDVDSLARRDIAAHFAGHRHRGGADVGGYHGRLADRDAVLCDDLAVDFAVDAGGTFE